MKKILGAMRKAIEEFSMISKNDTVAVGVSGGKDSLLLLYALSQYKKYIKPDFELFGITVDVGFPGFESKAIEEFSHGLGLKHVTVKTDIFDIVFNERKEKNPCALCSKMRKGALYEAAKREGANKAAFAHHADDLIETLLLSLLYESRINTFSPVTYLSRSDITLVRPFIYLYESEIIHANKTLGISSFKNPCPVDKATKREEIHRLVGRLIELNPDAKHNILNAIITPETYNLWDKLKQRLS